MDTHTNIDKLELGNLLNESAAARILGLSVKTLQRDRYKSQGLPYVKLGKVVRYDPAVLKNYIDAHRVNLAV